MAKAEKEYSVPALEKSIMILNALSESELTIGELYTRLNLPKSTTFVLLNTLEQHAIIEKTPEGKFRLGSGMFRWCISYLKSMDLVRIARPYLQRLVANTPYTVHLAVLADRRAVYIDKVEGHGFVRFATMIGQSMPVFMSGVGKALALGMTAAEIEACIQQEHAANDKQRPLEIIREDIAFVRQHGFSIEDEEFEEGVRCIGAPIYDFSEKVVASISITALSKDLPAIKYFSVGELVKETALLISRELGYMRPKG